MKKLLMMVAVVAAAALVTSTWAQDSQPATGKGRIGKHAGMGANGKGMRGHGKGGLLKGVELTDAQKPKVRDIMTKQKEAVAAWRKDNGPKLKDLHTKLADAKKANDDATVKTVKADIAKIMETRKTLRENLIKSLGDVLTADQMTKVNENAKNMKDANGGKGHRGWRGHRGHKGGTTSAPAGATT